MSGDAIAAAARRLREAAASGTPCAPVRDILPAEDVVAAYAVQRLNNEQAIAAGRRPVGCKIGLTAKAVQRQLGVDQPDYGVLFADMALGDNEEIAWGAVMQPKAEGEVALILERDLNVERPTVADVLRATAYAVPAIEVVDSRIANWDIRIVDTIADNASSGLFVLGGPARRIDGLDLMGARMEMERAGEKVSSGSGAACLGSPLNAAAWLAGKMVQMGQPLRAGDTIMTGALGPMAAIAAGDSFEVRIEGLGSARVSFAPSRR